MEDNHSLKGVFIVLVFGLVVGFVLGWWLCNRGQADIVTTVETTIDTTKYYNPKPIEPTIVERIVTIPKLVYVPADTIVKTIVRVERDTIEVSYPVEQREYKDSTYYAVISGAVVGERRPTLDYIETYNKTTTIMQAKPPKKLRPYVGASVGVFGTWSVGINGGVLIKDHHAVGAGYERTQTDNRLKLNYSYLF